MSRSNTAPSHLICPTCQANVSDKKALGYFANIGGPHARDNLLSLSEEVVNLVRFLGALAQAAPRAVAHGESAIDHDWVTDLAWLAEELTEETTRRLNLLQEAAKTWMQRAKHSPERKEG